MNVPVPQVFLSEDQYGAYSVIDGKQRLTAISLFMRGRLTLEGLEFFKEFEGETIDSLQASVRSALRTRPTLRATIVLRQSDPTLKFEVFKRLNTGGVQLNPQEIRNATYTGPLNDSILDLSVNRRFHSLLGIRSKKDQEKSVIYQEMRDAELVLRYLTFRSSWETFSGSLIRSMNGFMELNRRAEEPFLGELREDFLSTIDAVTACFGHQAFRRWLPQQGKWKNQVLAALYDAQMFACRGVPVDLLRPKQRHIVAGMQQLFENADFERAISAATNAPTSFRLRIEMVKSLITEELRG